MDGFEVPDSLDGDPFIEVAAETTLLAGIVKAMLQAPTLAGDVPVHGRTPNQVVLRGFREVPERMLQGLHVLVFAANAALIDAGVEPEDVYDVIEKHAKECMEQITRSWIQDVKDGGGDSGE